MFSQKYNSTYCLLNSNINISYNLFSNIGRWPVFAQNHFQCAGFIIEFKYFNTYIRYTETIIPQCQCTLEIYCTAERLPIFLVIDINFIKIFVDDKIKSLTRGSHFVARIQDEHS